MADNDIPSIGAANPSLSEPRQKPTTSKFKWLEFKWSKNAAEHTITALKTMEKAAGALPIPGVAAVFFLTAEIVRNVDDTKENKHGFRLLAEEANALACTLWEECAEIQKNERRASLWKNLSPHVDKFNDILQSIKNLMEKKHDRNPLLRYHNVKKDAGYIQELHNKLKAAVDRFSVAMQIASRASLDRIEEVQADTGGAINRIEALLTKMRETGQELQTADTNSEARLSDTLAGSSANAGPEVVRPSSGSQDKAFTLESTTSNIPVQDIDVVTPTPQVPFPLQQSGSTSSSAPSQDGDLSGYQSDRGTPPRTPDVQGSLLSQETRFTSSEAHRERAFMESQESQATSSRSSDSQSVYSMPSFTGSRTESPKPMSRAESSFASLHSTRTNSTRTNSTRTNSTNPFWRVASVPDPGRTFLPPPPTSNPQTINSFSSRTSDEQNPFSNMLSSGMSVSGNVTMNNVTGGQNNVSSGNTTHNVNTGNYYNNNSINSNNRYDSSMDPSFHSYGPSYNLHPQWAPPPPPPNDYHHHYQPQPPPRPHHYQSQWPTPTNHYQSDWQTPPNRYQPPWQPPSNSRGRGGPY